MTMSRREQRPLRGCRAKAQKMASTSSPCSKSGRKAGKSKEAALEAPMSNKPYILPVDMKLTSDQEEKIKEKVRAIGSEFPVLVKVMTKPGIDEPTKLEFCLEYARACLPLEQTPIILGLERSKMQWPSMLKVKRYTDGKWITKSWKELVLQAGMKPGDICLVELARRSNENLKMTVHLIRERNRSSSSQASC
ncbi:B3 domain-containing protein Os03g0620400-like [Triticum aestivum]|uniref:B3 domain-containing protein Os03g0620400-like n=1 Tax=Triticum aestivum TaxID=4565 RepID=UPI001D023133|nr:B3 domain-containing protein Os03g0620400-like [Triticum aestivum]